MDIIFLVASDGKNLELAKSLQASLDSNVSSELLDLTTLNVPLYTPQENKNGIPDAVKDLTDKVKLAKALVLVAPEYNGSIPPVMTNAIAWISTGGDDDWRQAFNYKFAVVATHSGGGGLKVLQAMRSQLEHLGATVLARGIQTNYQKQLNPESVKAILGQLQKLIQ